MPPALELLHHARDLGFELRYSGGHRVGHRAERHQNAVQRLKRLTHLKADCCEKEKLWLVSVFPQDFYGSEICPPSQDIIKKFRSKAADAIYGVSQSMSPAIALFLGKKHILDPGYQLIWKAIVAARRWLVHATQRQRETFYELVATFRGGITKVRGPASALSLYLADVESQFTRDGHLLVGPFTRIHLVDSSLSRLRRFLTIAWQQDFLMKYTERKHLYNMLPPSRIDTVALLNKFQPDERCALIREIAGAFQTKHQQAEWQEDGNDACVHCSMPDSRHHRIFCCPAFANVRIPFQPCLDWCEENATVIADLPVIPTHEDELSHQVVQFADVKAVIGDRFYQLAKAHRDADSPLFAYTDGSCQFPQHPTTRIAGFAVVIDLCYNDDMRRHKAQVFLDAGAMPDTFQTMCQSRVQGEQNIGRAEFAAIEVVTRLPCRVVTFSDSQVSLHAVDQIRKLQFDFVKGHNLDIAETISLQLHDGHVFRKIKSHQTPSPEDDLLDVYHMLGNQAADMAANATCLPAWSELTAQLTDRHHKQEQWRENVFQLYKCILALQAARIQAEHVAELVPSEQLLDAKRNEVANLQVIMNYAPVDPFWQPFPESGKPLFEHYPWGTEFAVQFERWYNLLSWPATPHAKPCCRSGVSWIELAISFSLYVGKLLPVIRTSTHASKVLLHLETDQDQADYHVTLSDLAYTMTLMWGHFVSYIYADEQLQVKRGLVRALGWLGFGQQTCGLSKRPQFYMQNDVANFLSRNISGKTSLDFWVALPWLPKSRAQAIHQSDWIVKRTESYKRRRLHWATLRSC